MKKTEDLTLEEKLMGNQEGSLDEFLLNSPLHTQEERELIMEAVYLYLVGKFKR